MFWLTRHADMAIISENKALREKVADLESRLARQTAIHSVQVNTIARLRGALSDVAATSNLALFGGSQCSASNSQS